MLDNIIICIIFKLKKIQAFLIIFSYKLIKQQLISFIILFKNLQDKHHIYNILLNYQEEVSQYLHNKIKNNGDAKNMYKFEMK